jgi:hypothetical protein
MWQARFQLSRNKTRGPGCAAIAKMDWHGQERMTEPAFDRRLAERGHAFSA